MRSTMESLNKRLNLIDFFEKVAKGKRCSCRRSGAMLTGNERKVVFNKPYFDDNGENIILGYCVCEKCGGKVYISLSTEWILDNLNN